ncbi:MAG: hypothetical protein AVDCRST_MAG49-4211, partial [uncultured Thermomicrobiales bacterium]
CRRRNGSFGCGYSGCSLTWVRPGEAKAASGGPRWRTN